MTRIILTASLAAILVCQVAGQVQTTGCSLPVNGAQLPPEIDPLGCSRPGGMMAPNYDLDGRCRTFTAGASLPTYFDPLGCTRPGGVTNPIDPAYRDCNTYTAGAPIPNGLNPLLSFSSRCPNVRYENGRLILYTGTPELYYYYFLTGEGRYIQNNYY